MRDFLLNLRRDDSLLIRDDSLLIFEAGTHTFNPDHLLWENPPAIWTTPFAGSLYEDMEDRSLFSLLAFTSLAF